MSKISCDIIQDMLPLYYDEVCSADSRKMIEEHLQECEKCSNIFQKLKTECVVDTKENAGDYIAHKLKNPSAAERTVRGIRAKINSLADFPERNELDEDKLLAGLGVRKDYYRNYKIYYVIEKDTIYIVRILHMLVDSKAWLYRTFGV